MSHSFAAVQDVPLDAGKILNRATFGGVEWIYAFQYLLCLQYWHFETIDKGKVTARMVFSYVHLRNSRS